jgi:hypothetical protein
MPLIVGSVTPPGQGGPVVAPRDRPAAWWIDPTGQRWELNDDGNDSLRFLINGVKGVNASVPITITTDDRARGGTAVRHIQKGPRLLTLPVRLEGPDHTAFLKTWRDFEDAICRTSDDFAPGWFVVARPDGTARRIQAWYQDGFDDTGADASGMTWDSVVLTMYCPDGHWQDLVETVATRQGSPGGVDFLSPYPMLSSDQTLGDSVVHNPGQVEAWTNWTITGPASLITATNSAVADGENTWTLDPTAVLGTALAAGQTITITGDPPLITGPGTGDWNLAMDWAHSDLWPLLRGDNPVNFAVSGAGAGTSIELRFAPRYRSA